jgi:DNA-binding CsgD family transcriptional regulator
MSNWLSRLWSTSIEGDAIRDAHAACFLEFVERGWPHFGPGRVAKVREVEREIGNIYVALGWLMQRQRAEPALRLANGLIYTLWIPRGRVRDLRDWLHRAVELPGTGLEAERAGAYVGLALAAARSGHFDEALSAAEAALTHARASEDPEKMAWALIVKGIHAWRTGILDEARVLLERANAIAGELDDRFLLGWSHHNLAVHAVLAGDETRAASHFEAAQAILQDLGDPWEVADLQGNLAWYLETKGEISRSAELDRHALEEHHRLGDAWLVQFSLFVAGLHATEISMYVEAARVFCAMEQLRRQTGSAVPFGYEEDYGRHLTSVRRRLGEAKFAAAWAAGESMDLDTAVTEADAIFAAWGRTEASNRAPAAILHGLSPREMEVLRLVASGMSNRAIADALSISVPTVKVHVRSIMGKLGLDSRTALAAFAIRHQLD